MRITWEKVECEEGAAYLARHPLNSSVALVVARASPTDKRWALWVGGQRTNRRFATARACQEVVVNWCDRKVREVALSGAVTARQHAARGRMVAHA